MLSLLRRRPKPEAPAPVVEIAPIEEAVTEAEQVRRIKQQNIKASEDCCATFAALAKAQGITKSELFEDLVAERLETLQRQGVRVEFA